jgi:hypothetical protein
MAEVFPPSPQGDWAGNAWLTSGCGPGTCVDCKESLAYSAQLPNSLTPVSLVVDNNPIAFGEAYWEINSLRVYTPDSY